LADPGDLAWSGRPLFRLMDPSQMRLEAHVREGLVGRVKIGQKLNVAIDALAAEVQGSTKEIVPSTDPASRTFIVKISLPSDDRMLPGMFGRLLIPTGTRSTILVPTRAVNRIGQLQTVRVRQDGNWTLRAVRTGPTFGTQIEVLSGLDAGETVELEGTESDE